MKIVLLLCLSALVPLALACEGNPPNVSTLWPGVTLGAALFHNRNLTLTIRFSGEEICRMLDVPVASLVKDTPRCGFEAKRGGGVMFALEAEEPGNFTACAIFETEQRQRQVSCRRIEMAERGMRYVHIPGRNGDPLISNATLALYASPRAGWIPLERREMICARYTIVGGAECFLSLTEWERAPPACRWYDVLCMIKPWF